MHGALLGAGLVGILCGLDGTTGRGAEPHPHAAPRLLATPIPFNDLIRLLDHPRPAIRLEAINHLGTLNRPAGDVLPALRRRFDDPDLAVRVHAVQVAIRAGMPVQQAVPVAIPLLVPDRPDICCPAARILGEAGPAASDALPNLHACLTAQSIVVRLSAARAALLIDAADLASQNVLQSACKNEQGAPQEFAEGVLAEIVIGLTEQLRHVDPAVRLAAVIRLEQLGTIAASATPAIIATVADKDLIVRVHAARAALRTGAPTQQIVEVVTDLLVPERFDVLRVAALILVEIGPEAQDALPKLHECLQASSIAVRLHAAEAALRIEPTDRRALSELKAGIESHATDARYFSVNALGVAVLDDDEAVFALQCALSDPSPKVATAAALHLSRTNGLARHAAPGAEAGDQPFAQAVATDDPNPISPEVAIWIENLSDAADLVRQAAAIRLAIAGPAARDAVPALIDRLGDPDPVVRLHVAQALWEIERSAYPILPVLVDLLLTNRADTRIGAVYTLGRMGPVASGTVPWLTQLLKQGKPFDQLLLAEAIVRIVPMHQPALEILLKGPRSHDADVRYLSTIALGAVPLSQQAAVQEALLAAVADRNSRVRSAANETLCQLQIRNFAAHAAKPAPVGPVIPASATRP